MDRREFLTLMGTSACWGGASHLVAQTTPEQPKADLTLRISSVEIDIGNRRTIKTTGYNGSAPGPVLRLPEGKPVTVDIYNETSAAELVHWHGLFVPPEVDGAEEEGTPLVPAHGFRRYSFVPRPSGTRWYHTHIHAGRNLKQATYTGQFGLLYVEPKDEPGDYDQEVFLALHGWDPYLSTKGDAEGAQEVVYKSFSINSHALGYGDPISVSEGQRVIFRILNANATMQHRIAFSGHKFSVVSLDGNRVPVPREVEVLELGPAERVDAIVTMSNPGVWILGEADSNLRSSGMGWWLHTPSRTKWLVGLSRPTLPGTTRLLDALGVCLIRTLRLFHLCSAASGPETVGWIIGRSTESPIPRPTPFLCRPTSAIGLGLITKATNRIRSICIATHLN